MCSTGRISFFLLFLQLVGVFLHFLIVLMVGFIAARRLRLELKSETLRPQTQVNSHTPEGL